MEYFENDLHGLLRWELVTLVEDDHSGGSSEEVKPRETVHTLKRDLFSRYGSYPKIEDRIYSSCILCDQVFNPKAVASHREHCTGKGKSLSPHLKKKLKNNIKIRGLTVPLPPLFKEHSPLKLAEQSTLYNQKEFSSPPVLSKFSDITPQATRLTPEGLSSFDTNDDIPDSTPPLLPPLSPTRTLPPDILSEPAPLLNNNSRHKKSKKNIKSFREYDPDVHCGVMEGQKGPCTRSITCSNHKIQLRKSVEGRSKNIHVLIAEKKAAKEKELRRSPPRDTNDIEHAFILSDSELAFETSEDIISPLISHFPPELTNGHCDDLKLEDELEDALCSDNSDNSNSSVLYPISPISVTPFIQKENSLFGDTPIPHSPPNGYYLSIPEASPSIKLYKSQPKPTFLPSYGARKVGGAILTSYRRLEFQRSSLHEAIHSNASSCKTAFNVPARSILLKTKSITKASGKRSSIDKLNASESKQIKLSADVNGFILHTDMSEIAEAAQANHCIQENINLLNIK